MCHIFEFTSDNSDFVPLFFPHSFILQLGGPRFSVSSEGRNHNHNHNHPGYDLPIQLVLMTLMERVLVNKNCALYALAFPSGIYNPENGLDRGVSFSALYN